MHQKPLFTILIILALASVACGIQINLPKSDVKTGPTTTEEIVVPRPDSSEQVTDLTLAFGAGTLKINPGATEALVNGTATYNVADFKPEIKIEGDNILIEQGDLNLSGFPSFDENIKNEWDFMLSEDPLDLTIKAGAYVGRYELGGLSLKQLEISDGASDVSLSFSEPNRIEMDTLRYNTGASSITLEKLANANFSQMIFRSGAGSYRLDFSGELQREANVDIESGISSLVIIIPVDVNAEVTVTGGMSNVQTSESWKQSGDTYTQTGDGPQLKITIQMGAGNLELRGR